MPDRFLRVTNRKSLITSHQLLITAFCSLVYPERSSRRATRLPRAFFAKGHKSVTTFHLTFVVVLAFLIGAASAIALAQQARKPFTVADEIGLMHFGDPVGGQADAVRASPDGNYFAVDTERGRLDLNRPEDSCDSTAVRTSMTS